MTAQLLLGYFLGMAVTVLVIAACCWICGLKCDPSDKE